MTNEKGYELSFTAEQINVNLGNAEKAILYAEQSLTDEQKAQARKNIGCGDSGGGSGLVRITLETSIPAEDGGEVSLTEAESAMLEAAVATKMPCVIEFTTVFATFTCVFFLMSLGEQVVYGTQFDTMMFSIVRQEQNNWMVMVAAIE